MRWEADFTMTLVSVAIVFPVVFSISSAYQRRENALKQLAMLRSNALSFFYSTRDWTDNTSAPIIEKIKELQKVLFTNIRNFLASPQEEAHHYEKPIFECFSSLSKQVAELKHHGLTASEITRVGQYHNNMMICFNVMKSIFYYRTPISLRAYYRFFIYIFALLYGPYFAQMKHSQSLPDYLIYIMPMMYSAILVSLDNIQYHLEQPFDGVGEDDIQVNVEEYTNLLTD
ncbi:MAG: hypothetical protein EAZ85_08500 [Bacteroidetes bacterium]|nr:MAG: hypothetical protein EAZ85_08500 [Bacteroidota bacterium]TAG87402.1 MAG: hypothetical protein EAZ20_10660 [Bacteroidota bacterium]